MSARSRAFTRARAYETNRDTDRGTPASAFWASYSSGPRVERADCPVCADRVVVHGGRFATHGHLVTGECPTSGQIVSAR